MTWLSPDERSNLQYPFTAQGPALKQRTPASSLQSKKPSHGPPLPASSHTPLYHVRLDRVEYFIFKYMLTLCGLHNMYRLSGIVPLKNYFLAVYFD